jgi:lipopolysaccharide export system permease protein
MRNLSLKLIDYYIIKKFLGTFFFSLILILTIAVVFDFSEKIDDFMEKNAPAKAIIFDYYLNFIPYFATLFAPLFVFITVIFFTSKMAYNTEIVAILNSGMSFRRMMWPYFLSSLFIAVFTFALTNYVIPTSNQKRLIFENKYYKARYNTTMLSSIHRQVYPNIYIYMESYNPGNQSGRNFTIEKFDNDSRLLSKLSASMVKWDTTSNKWSAWDYYIRDIGESAEIISSGRRIDTTLTITPDDFSRSSEFVATMTYRELYDYIDLLRLQGSDELKLYLVEKHKRYSIPFSVFILSLIGVSLSSKKVRGGIGMQIGIGLLLSFTYILFLQFASQFSLKGNLDPMLAMWIPNMVYALIALFLYRIAPK